MTDLEALTHSLTRIADVLDAMSVSWAVGGSIASSVYGEPRATNDIDVIATLSEQQARGLVAQLGDEFYANEDSAADAVRRRSSFNVIDNHSLVKVDIFVPAQGPLGVGQLERVRHLSAFPGMRPVPLLGPEDIVLQKLRWHRSGGGVSDRQWRDLVSILRIVGARIDGAYLEDVAAKEGLMEALERARSDAKDGSR
jgi:hypothetical protein